MKIIFGIFCVTLIASLLYLNSYKKNDVSELKNKYAKEIKNRPLKQAMNKIFLTSKKPNDKKLSRIKNNEEAIKVFQARINNELLYKDKMPLSNYFSNTEESQNIFNMLFAKFHLKNNEGYFKYRRLMLEEIRKNKESTFQSSKNN